MNYFRIKMDREKIFNTFFKHDNKGEQKFNGFSQLTPVGKRVTYLIIHLALGGNKPKTFEECSKIWH